MSFPRPLQEKTFSDNTRTDRPQQSPRAGREVAFQSSDMYTWPVKQNMTATFTFWGSIWWISFTCETAHNIRSKLNECKTMKTVCYQCNEWDRCFSKVTVFLCFTSALKLKNGWNLNEKTVSSLRQWKTHHTKLWTMWRLAAPPRSQRHERGGT